MDALYKPTFTLLYFTTFWEIYLTVSVYGDDMTLVISAEQQLNETVLCETSVTLFDQTISAYY